jgi:sulfhydrogenase subunit alpha
MTGLPSPSSAASGCATTETSRGLLYPRYRVNTDGLIEEKQSYPTHITKPENHWERSPALYPAALDLAQEQLTWQCEQAVRNYDPASPSQRTFLNRRIERTEETNRSQLNFSRIAAKLRKFYAALWAA